MITRAIVEELINAHQVKVRIPIFDASKDASLNTDPASLCVATICTLPNFLINVQVGDVLFVGFEDNTTYKAVVLGYLSRNNQSDTLTDIEVKDLFCEGRCSLSSNTSIGEISPSELAQLKGVRDNLQNQIDLLSEKLENLRASLS